MISVEKITPRAMLSLPLGHEPGLYGSWKPGFATFTQCPETFPPFPPCLLVPPGQVEFNFTLHVHDSHALTVLETTLFWKATVFLSSVEGAQGVAFVLLSST